MGHPTIYPTGVTVYDPTRAYDGYTIFQAPELGALLIDMGFGTQDQLDLVQVDWEGNIVCG